SSELGIEGPAEVRIEAEQSYGSELETMPAFYFTKALIELSGNQDIRSSQTSVEAWPLFLLADGETANFRNGENVPIPRRSTSPEGTSITEGYDFLQTG